MSERIEYTIAQSFSEKDGGWWTVYYFYPGGEWDEDKLNLEEAIHKYPLAYYDWHLFALEYDE